MTSAWRLVRTGYCMHNRTLLVKKHYRQWTWTEVHMMTSYLLFMIFFFFFFLLMGSPHCISDGRSVWTARRVIQKIKYIWSHFMRIFGSAYELISPPLTPSLSLSIYIYICVFFFFIIQRVKARAILCPHQPPTRGDNTVSVAQSGTATPGATKQLLPPEWLFKRSPSDWHHG